MEEDAVSQSKDGATGSDSTSNWCEDGLFSTTCWGTTEKKHTDLAG